MGAFRFFVIPPTLCSPRTESIGTSNQLQLEKEITLIKTGSQKLQAQVHHEREKAKRYHEAQEKRSPGILTKVVLEELGEEDPVKTG